MAAISVESIKQDRIEIRVEDATKGVVVRFIGDIDMEDPSKLLDPFLAKVHSEAIEKKLEVVSADFTKLNFLNSSGIKSIAKWVMKLSTAEHKYKLRFLHDPSISWQATSLQTLTFLVPGAVTVEK